MRSKIDWANLIVGKKFTVFALFYVVLEGNFQVQALGGAYVWRGDLTEGFLRYEFGGLIFGEVIHGGAYLQNFTVLYWCCSAEKFPHPSHPVYGQVPRKLSHPKLCRQKFYHAQQHHNMFRLIKC